MRRSARLFAALLPCGLLACAAEPSTATADAAGSGGVGTEASGSTGADPDGSGGGTDDSADGSSTEPEPEFVPYPARGVGISEVFANQGVAVPIVRDGQWVDGTGRNAELIRNRNTLIRGYWELDEDFVPRTIRGRLTLVYSDGTEEVAEKDFEIEGPSRPAQIDTNMYFVVPGELLPVGVRFKIELFETETGYEDLPEPGQLSFPPEPGFLGVEDKDMALKVVIVPIQHDLGAECPEAPEVTDDELQFLADQLFMQNPVERIEIERRDTVAYTNSLASFGGLLGFVADLRATDGADPGAYYYGVVRPCDGGPDGVGGQAISIPDFPTPDNAWTRVSVGRWYPGLSSTANTFVHEVGHTQGRRHIFCNGEEGGTDPSYPYESGDIGVWGFGVLDFSLHTPTNGKDYMTYCGNTWVSDWTWGKVSPVIEEITSWDAQDGGAVPASGQILVGLIEPATGDETWFTTVGSAEGRVVDGTEPMRFTSPAGDVQALGTYGPMGDADAYAVVVPLPETVRFASDLQITRTHDGEVHSVAAVRVGGGPTLQLAE